MKLINSNRWPLILFAFLLWNTGATAADTNAIRLAIGPFFAPAGNAALEKAASELPDLLTAALPQDGRFQLVERDKVNVIWSELHLAETGMTSADTVAKLGHMLTCDWLVSGTFSTSASGTQIWVKVINTQDSVVLDLQSVPYTQTNLSATAGAIGAFIAQAQSHSRPREFIALGRFDDWSISTTHEDWSQRLVALLEKHFLAAGYGVVERDAVAPIFAEYQFQAAGLTASSTNRVKLKPAFWIVDGGCKWIHDTADKLSVSIRVQKMGGGDQVFDFVKPPGDELEKEVLDTVASALASTGSGTLAQAQAGEEKARSEHLGQLIQGRGALGPLHPSTNETFVTITNAAGETRQMRVDPAFLAQRKMHADELTKTLQQEILLNPKDMRAKFFLGTSLYGRQDAVQSKQGEDLLEEVAASNDENFATKAKNWLSDIRSGRITMERDPLGNLHMVTHGQPASYPAVDSDARAKGFADLKAKMEAMKRHTNAATRAESVVKLPALPEGGGFGGFSAIKLWQRSVFVAGGATLQKYDIDANTTHEVNLPMHLNTTISAIEVENNILWLGTGEGLYRVSLSDGTVRQFSQKDGFPTAAISVLRLVNGRLFIGFYGAFGYLDTSTEKFTGMMSGVSLHTDGWAQAMKKPPGSYICSITTPDGTNFWVSSQHAFQHFDFSSNTWSAGTPEYLNTEVVNVTGNEISINSKYLAAKDYKHCAAACLLPGPDWTRVDLVTNQDNDDTTSIALDPAEPDYLWVGGFNGKVTLLDLASNQIIGEGKVTGPAPAIVQWIFPLADRVICLAGSPDGSYSLDCLDKAALLGTPPLTFQPPAATPAAEASADPRQRFLQNNFSKFVPVQFQKDTDGKAKLQRLDVKAIRFESGGSYYCGFRFTVPAWLDGDFGFMYGLAKKESEKDYYTKNLDSNIVAEKGEVGTFGNYEVTRVADCPRLQQQLPYTVHMNTRYLDMAGLKAGQNYAIWFQFDDPNLPDIAYSITIQSARGNSECGELPEFDAAQVPVAVITHPTSAEQLRSRVEAALKAKDRSTLIALVDWEGVADDDKRTVINDHIDVMLEHEISSVSLAPLQPLFTWTTEVNGVRIRPNVPLLGQVDIKYTEQYEGGSMPYGKVGDAYYISVNVREPIGK